MKFKAVPYIDSVGKKEYQKILLQLFNISFLIRTNKNFDDTLFHGWSGMEMAGSWYKLENFEEKTTIEFYSTYYHVMKKFGLQTKYVLPLPRTLNDFISDCNRCDVNLWWNENAIKQYTPKVLLIQSDIDLYYKDILIKIGKE